MMGPMSIKETLQSDLTESIRSRNELHTATIRMVLTAITNEEVSGKSARVLTDAEIITVLSRESKKRREAAEAFAAGDRQDRSDREKAEGEVIALYLPAQLGEAELAQMIKEAVAESGAAGPSGMGAVMKLLQPKMAGKADGAMVSAAVKSALDLPPICSAVSGNWTRSVKTVKSRSPFDNESSGRTVTAWPSTLHLAPPRLFPPTLCSKARPARARSRATTCGKACAR